LKTIEQDFSLNEMILRMMVLRIDPKLVETMLSVAKGEHAVALHNYQEPAEEGGGGAAPAEEEMAGAGRK
jgi:hypothetical protein